MKIRLIDFMTEEEIKLYETEMDKINESNRILADLSRKVGARVIAKRNEQGRKH